MAISANAVWDTRTTATASNVNGGFFVTGASGVDYSQQNAAQYALTGMTTVGISAIILTASAATDMVGNGIKITGGTNFTTGWYEIVSVVAGVSITVDRNATTGVGAVGTGNVGGSMSLGSSDDAVFEAMVNGNIMYVKNGTYTIGGTVTIAAAGASGMVIRLLGYETTHGDNPTGSTRPIFDCGAATFTFGAFWRVRYMQFTGTNATMLQAGADNAFMNCKFSNTSGTAGRTAFMSSNRNYTYKCEFTSTNGNAGIFNYCILVGCYLHDSVDGIRQTSAANGVRATDCIISNCTNGVDFTTACTDSQLLLNCTIYGAASPAGTGINAAAGNTDIMVLNCIVYGWTTGMSHGTSNQTSCTGDTIMFFNNTTDTSNWSVITNLTTGTDPGFVAPGSGNYAVTNRTAKQGGEPGIYPGGLTTSVPAIGAVQPIGGAGTASVSA